MHYEGSKYRMKYYFNPQISLWIWIKSPIKKQNEYKVHPSTERVKNNTQIYQSLKDTKNNNTNERKIF